MENLNTEIKRKIISFLKNKKIGSSSSEISKNIGHNRITVSKYLEIMKAHKILEYDDIAQAKIWHLSERENKTKILIVDDEPHIVELIKLSLMREDRIIIEAYSGFDALDKVNKETPDLIILDLMMPGLNGFEVCQKLKQEALTQHIPVLILSAKSEIEDKLRGINVGAEDYMTKPFDPLELEARISNLIISSDLEIEINPLTGLHGKNSLIEYLASSEYLFIYKIKINNLKEVNKNEGFKRGNELITLIGKMLKEKVERVFHLPKDIFIVYSEIDCKKNIQDSFKNMLPYIYNEKIPEDKIKLSYQMLSDGKTKINLNKIISKID